MRYALLILIVLVAASCEQFPVNPIDGSQEPEMVLIEHFETDYVPAESSVEGIAATKVNVLSFHLKAENFNPKAIEVYGRAILEGSPGNQEHSIHFRTDSLWLNLSETGYEFNTLSTIQQGATYTLIRAKFPTNEYAPFEGLQGMVKELTITEVWAYDESGKFFEVEFEELN